MKKYLVIGSTGLVGSRFVEMVKEERLENPTSENIDITNKKSIEDYFSERKDSLDVVINFAAYTNVQEAENERDSKEGACWNLNVIGAENLAEVCDKYNKFLVHISTDFVFEGLKENPGPYAEDEPLPDSSDNLSWYGWTKLQGEKAVENASGNSAIVRISYPYRNSFDKKTDFARSILSLYDEGKLYPMFADQKMTPTFVDDLVPVLEKILDLSKKGIYHAVNSGLVSPYEFASYLLEKARGVTGVVEKGSLVEFLKNPQRNKRPIWGGLKTEKTERALGMKFKTWQEAIDDFVEKLNS